VLSPVLRGETPLSPHSSSNPHAVNGHAMRWHELTLYVYFNHEDKLFASVEITRFLRLLHLESAAADVQHTAESSQPELPLGASSSLWEAHDNLPLSAVINDTEELPQYEQELASYLKEPRVSRTTDIYAYWHGSQYPTLEPAARKYLSAPPTSVASEQMFSAVCGTTAC